MDKPQSNAQTRTLESSKVFLKTDTALSTPVDLNTQPDGTELLLVTPDGNVYPIVAGVFNLAAFNKTKFNRAKGRDTGARFPNLAPPTE